MRGGYHLDPQPVEMSGHKIREGGKLEGRQEGPVVCGEAVDEGRRELGLAAGLARRKPEGDWVEVTPPK